MPLFQTKDERPPIVVGCAEQDFNFTTMVAGLNGFTAPTTGYIITTPLSTLAVNTSYTTSGGGEDPADGSLLPTWDQKLQLGTGVQDISTFSVPGSASLPSYPLIYAAGSAAHGQFGPADPNYPNYLYVQIDIQGDTTPYPFTLSYGLFVKADASDVRGVYTRGGVPTDGYFFAEGTTIFVNGY